MFSIPSRITQGDLIEWLQILDNYNPATDILKCFIRGKSALDLTGVANGDGWNFTIDSTQSALLNSGKYKSQFVIFEFGTDKKTLGTTDLLVCSSFESLTELDTRSADEIELEEINNALNKGITEYRIGDRMMRYHSLEELSKRQKYLRNRIAIAQGKIKPGGRNLGVGFCD